MSSDYFMRQIEGMADMLSTIMLGQKANEREDAVYEAGNSTEGHQLLLDLRFLLAGRRVNEAENLLFARMEADRDTSYREAAMAFYDWLERLSDEELESCDFTRQEISEGRDAVIAFYSRPTSKREF